jgi:transcriptional regulator with XRE-family HTH domain
MQQTATHEVQNAFAGRLKMALEKNGVRLERGTAARIQREIGVSHVAVKKWLDGQGLPSQKRMMTLARWLNVSYEWLSSGQGKMQPLNLQDEEETLIHYYRKSDHRGRLELQDFAARQAAYSNQS